nr:PREDICTED: SRR1-like protein isoform X1 [Lepisosteus oculatus]
MAGGSGEWQKVQRKKGRSRPRRWGGQGQQGNCVLDDAPDTRQLRERITAAMKELRIEDFWQVWRELLVNSLSSDPPAELGSGSSPSQDKESACSSHPKREGAVCAASELDCVCYGLGNFSSCVSSRYQLALLLLLLESLQVPPQRCCVYDPVFSAAETKVLQALGLTVLTENEEGKRLVYRPTLFYLIHCGKALYNNLLWRNWSTDSLPLLTIVGNSFCGIQESTLERVLKRDYTYIRDIMRACEETPLPCPPRLLDVFNNTVLLRFPPELLASLPSDTWADPPEPDYQHCPDLEIIQAAGALQGAGGGGGHPSTGFRGAPGPAPASGAPQHQPCCAVGHSAPLSQGYTSVGTGHGNQV